MVALRLIIMDTPLAFFIHALYKIVSHFLLFLNNLALFIILFSFRGGRIVYHGFFL